MRKLNKKNKAYIIALSCLTAVIFIIVVLFIVYKIKDHNIKYFIPDHCVVFNTDNELITLEEKTTAQKNFINGYYVNKDKNKVQVGSNPVFYNEKDHYLKLLGTFYEILPGGEVNKIKGETEIGDTISSRIYKISDRKYLLVSAKITSEDGALNTKDYLLINIDKAGNGYLYNNDVHIKSFNDLVIKTSSFEFNVNAEKLIINNEIIDLAKINGSTNQYQETQKKEQEEGKDGSGNGPNGNDKQSQNQMENVVPSQDEEPEVTQEVIKEIITENKYITRKTTIISVVPTVNSLKINYVVYDPFNEYTKLYFKLYNGETEIGSYNLDVNLANYELNNLSSDTNYHLVFYYSYINDAGITEDVVFDSINKSTLGVSGQIFLEKVSSSSVSYILKIDDSIKLDSAKVQLYIDGTLVADAIDEVDVAAAANGGYHGIIEYQGTGNIAELVLSDCYYNGNNVTMHVTYKYKL